MIAKQPQLREHLVASGDVVPHQEPLFATVFEDDRPALGHDTLHFGEQL